MSAGLDASTVTPGSTAPDVSLTTPASVACACASPGSSTKQPRRDNRRGSLLMRKLPSRLFSPANPSIGRPDVRTADWSLRYTLVNGPSSIDIATLLARQIASRCAIHKFVVAVHESFPR